MADANLGELNLRITVDPDTGKLSVFNAEVDKLGAGVRDLGTESNSMAKAFERPLEHVGVHIFGHELLQTMGIANGARPILRLLSVGVQEVGASFGLAAQAALPYVFGLTALAAIIFKVVEAHKAHAEKLDEVLQKQSEALSSTNELRETLHRYEEQVGTLPKGLKELVDSLDKVDAAQRRALESSERLKIGQEVNAQMAKKAQVEAIKEHIQVLKDEDEAALSIDRAHHNHTDTIIALREQMAKLNDEIVASSAAQKKLEQDTVAQMHGDANAKEAAEKKIESKKKAVEADKAEIKSLEDIARDRGLTRDAEMQAEKNADDAAKKQHEADDKESKDIAKRKSEIELEQLAQAEKHYKALAAVGVAAAQEIEHAMEMSFARQVVEGKKMGESLNGLFKQVAEQAIAEVIRVEIRVALMKAGILAATTII